MGKRTTVLVLATLGMLLAAAPTLLAQAGLPGGLGGLGSLGQPQQHSSFTVSAALEPPQQAPGGRTMAELHFNAPPPHYVWKKGLTVELAKGAPAGVTAGQIVLPQSKRKQDKYANAEIEYFDGAFTVTLPLDVGRDAAPGDYDLEFQTHYTGCGPDLCQFRDDTATAALHVVSGAPTAVAMPSAPPQAPAAAPPVPKPSMGGFAGRSVLGAVLAAYAGGLLLAFTPCVYPLIPITISLVGATAGRSRLDGFVRSMAYVFGISITYSVAGVAASVAGSQFGAWLQSPVVYLVLAALFVALALAMLDAYSIDLSSQRLQRLQVRLQGKGGLLGIWLIGILSGAAATACIAPVIAGGLAYVAQRGSLVLGFLVFFAMAWGIGTPLVILGTFTGLAQALPRSGIWLNTVKRVFGLALLGVAVYYVGKSRVLPALYFRLLEAAFLLGAAVFIGAFDVLTARSGWWSRLRKTAGLLLLVWAVVVFVQPMLVHQEPGPSAQSIQWVDSEQQALAQGKSQGKPVLLDFWADWCVPCHEMFEVTYVDPRVVAESRQFVMGRVDTTDFSAAQRDDIRKRYDVMGYPTTTFIAADGSMQSHAGYIGPDDMLKLMKSVQ
jgi:thiol:disulfide interchange protein DsbD